MNDADIHSVDECSTKFNSCVDNHHQLLLCLPARTRLCYFTKFLAIWIRENGQLHLLQLWGKDIRSFDDTILVAEPPSLLTNCKLRFSMMMIVENTFDVFGNGNSWFLGISWLPSLVARSKKLNICILYYD